MASSRRDALRSLLLAPLAVASAQDPPQNEHSLPIPKSPDDDTRLPNGKSQHDEIAKQQHADALKDVETLVNAAEELRDELKRAGDYVIPVGSVRKTEEIEKLAKRIRGRLKS
jgi:Zn-dependent oligopeptidase